MRLIQCMRMCAQESMKKHSVNGYMFCQQPPVVAVQGQDVRIILIGIGGETDMHTPIFTDSVLVSPDATAYTRTLLPGSVRVVQLTTGARFSVPKLHPFGHAHQGAHVTAERAAMRRCFCVRGFWRVSPRVAAVHLRAVSRSPVCAQRLQALGALPWQCMQSHVPCAPERGFCTHGPMVAQG